MRGLTKFILFLAFLMGLYYVRDALIRSDIREKSMGFAVETASAATAGWNRAALDRVADPALASKSAATGNPHALDFAYFARLGGRVSEFSCTLGDYNTFKDETRNYISANYTCAAQFEGGNASVLMSIMRDKETAPWRVGYFDVVSPALSPATLKEKH